MSKFNQLKNKLIKEGKSSEQASGLAAYIGRKKFGDKRMEKAAKFGKPVSKVKV